MSFIQLKRGASSQWFTKNPILKSGELGVEIDTKKIKLGNGISRWNTLSYINVVPSDLENTLDSYIDSSEKGNPGGVATLNSQGYIPDSQIPSGIARDTEIITSYNNLDDLPTLFSGSYNDLTEKPTIPSLTGYATELYVGTAISNLVDSAPSTLNTLNELAAAINDDSSYAATITTALGGKVDSNYVTIGNTLLDGISGSTYGLIGTSEYLDVKNTNGYNKEIELDIAALETKLDADGYVKQAALDLKLNIVDVINVVQYGDSSSATSYTLSPNNSYKMTEFTAATDITITIPSDPLNTDWPIGSTCELRQMGTGRLIFSVTSPATIISTDGYLKTRTQYSSVFLEKRASNAWILTGDIDA